MNILIKARTISTKLGIRYYNGKVGIIGVPFDKGQVNMRYIISISNLAHVLNKDSQK